MLWRLVEPSIEVALGIEASLDSSISSDAPHQHQIFSRHPLVSCWKGANV
jgi:hypothetical protein